MLIEFGTHPIGTGGPSPSDDSIRMNWDHDAVSRRRNIISSLLTLAVAGGLLFVMRGAPQHEATGAGEAIDGDSLRLAGEEMRLKGIDAPEFTQTCKAGGRETPCGREARQALRKLLSSGLATCIGNDRDRFGRRLVICRLRGIEVNAAMVREGYAVAFGAYEREEAEAKAAYRGIWAGEFERPRDYRERTRPNG